MTYRVFKFVLPIADKVTVPLPRQAQILSVVEGDGLYPDRANLWLYALVDDGLEYNDLQQFIIKGTGHPIKPEELQNSYHLSTVKTSVGFVWHVFHHFEPLQPMQPPLEDLVGEEEGE